MICIRNLACTLEFQSIHLLLPDLKILNIRPNHPSHVDAVLYLTRSGLMPPLQKLSLYGVDFKSIELTVSNTTTFKSQKCLLTNYLEQNSRNLHFLKFQEIEAAAYHDALSLVHGEVEWNGRPGYPVFKAREASTKYPYLGGLYD